MIGGGGVITQSGCENYNDCGDEGGGVDGQVFTFKLFYQQISVKFQVIPSCIQKTNQVFKQLLFYTWFIGYRHPPSRFLPPSLKANTSQLAECRQLYVGFKAKRVNHFAKISQIIIAAMVFVGFFAREIRTKISIFFGDSFCSLETLALSAGARPLVLRRSL